MHKFFRNFFYSLLSTTFFLSPSAIANIQKRILVTEFVQSNEGELAEVDGLVDKRKDIIFNECLKSSVSKKRFNKSLQMEVKLLPMKVFGKIRWNICLILKMIQNYLILFG